ncbi:MAG: cyclic nucleotide-binding domain-containing protein [bacterium]
MIFDELSDSEMAHVEKMGTLKTYRPEETVVHEGRPGTSFFLVVSGKVEVRKSLRRGKYKKIVELGPLDVFGEVCFLGVEARSASIVSLTDSQIYEFDRDQFVTFMDRKPEIGVKVYRGMARELARRLAKASEDLRDAIIWSLGTQCDKDPHAALDIPKRPKLAINFNKTDLQSPPSLSGPGGHEVVF